MVYVFFSSTSQQYFVLIYHRQSLLNKLQYLLVTCWRVKKVHEAWMPWQFTAESFLICPHPYLFPCQCLCCQSGPHPVISLSPNDLLCQRISLLREGMSMRAMPGHSLGHKSATLTKLPPRCSCVGTYMHSQSCWVPRVAVQACYCVSRSCPLLCTRACLCYCVQAWLKRVRMQRSAPQLSETEMGFDFPNPVSERALGPQRTRWQCRRAVSNQTGKLLCAEVQIGMRYLIRLCILKHTVLTVF